MTTIFETIVNWFNKHQHEEDRYDLIDRINKVITQEFDKMRHQVQIMPNRDDKIHARLLMPDGGGVDKFVILKKIDELKQILILEYKPNIQMGGNLDDTSKGRLKHE